ncbi:sensor histidine kinase [Kribbella sp. NPDC051770]|uniref:sensor histidine kinase n=1 Tax=Kribbella sp. NPDC051770 TaxID=3155413 RepID=UPI00343E69A6
MTAEAVPAASPRRRALRPLVVDVVVAAVITLALDSLYVWMAPPWNSLYPPPSTAAQLVMLSPLSLVLLRRRPEVPAVVLALAASIAAPVLEPVPVLACVALAMFFLGLRRSRRYAATVALVVLAIPVVQQHVLPFRAFDYLDVEALPTWSSTLMVLAVLAASVAAGGYVRSTSWASAAFGNKLLQLLDDPVFRTWMDGLVAAGLLVLMVRELQNAPVGGDWSDAQQWVLLLTAAAPASMTLRRRIPEIPLVLLAFTCLVIYPLAQTQWVLLTAFALALYSIGVHRTWWKSALYAGTTLIALRVISWLLHDGPSARLIVADLYSVGDARMAELLQRIWPVWLSASLALAWAIGLLTQLALQNRQAAEREAVLVQKNQEQEQLQVLLEGRSQIARDLHDVVAHHVNLIVIQAETGPDLMQRERDDVLAGFQRIGDAGRKALGELDRMLSALRDAHGIPDPALTPQPGLADLRSLVDGLADQNLPVTFELRGSVDDVPAGVQLTAYRLVQEALTNVVKHAQASRVAIVVEAAPEGLTTRVSDDGKGFDPARTPDGRHGLTGMRERVRIHDGTLQLDTSPGSGTSVIAWLPVGQR